MTNPGDRLPSDHSEAPLQSPHAEAPPHPVATQQAVQQLRDTGFTAEEQAALTTAFLRVLALWTQQATRDDLQTALHTGEQRLAQQLETLRAELRHELAQHAEAVRADLREAMAQQADTLSTTRAASVRWWSLPLWLMTALLVLTCAGVLLLVVYRVLGW
jgi:hypothetical protein